VIALTREVRIVPMERAHLREVHRIDGLVYPKPWSLSLFRQELAMTDTRVYRVAAIGDEQVGHAGMMLVAGEAHITTVAVDPAWQGRGVATRLLIAMHRTAVERGIKALTLEVRVRNQRAIDLYRRFGYAPAGVRRNYYSEEGEDALVMWAHDVHQPAHAERLAGIEREISHEQRVDHDG
jgi:[ribosomal protein S18]-alanine N-acetyltransferase